MYIICNWVNIKKASKLVPCLQLGDQLHRMLFAMVTLKTVNAVQWIATLKFKIAIVETSGSIVSFLTPKNCIKDDMSNNQV